MRGNFDTCLKLVREWEGGNDDDPLDPGGRTSRGIEQREYTAYCKLHKLTSGLPADVWQAPDTIVDAIYREQYWLPYADLLPKGLDLVFFDTSVLEGMGKAVGFLQHALHIPADGHFGVVTASHVQDITNVSLIVRDITAQRRNVFRGMKMFWHDGRGWLDRAAKCQEAALEMIQNGVQPAPNVVA